MAYLFLQKNWRAHHQLDYAALIVHAVTNFYRLLMIAVYTTLIALISALTLGFGVWSCPDLALDEHHGYERLPIMQGTAAPTDIVVVTAKNTSEIVGIVEVVSEKNLDLPASTTSSEPTVPIVTSSRGAQRIIRPVANRASDLQWGVYTVYTQAELEAFEDMVEAEVDILMIFVDWETPFPAAVARNLAADSKTLLIFWENYGVTLDSIIAGEKDTYIQAFAAAAKAQNGEVIIAPFHEMNGDWYPWSGSVGVNTPDKVRLAWQHLFNTFGQATNVRFAWTVNNLSVPDTVANSIENYYPGDEYVDIVGINGFNFGKPWRSFDDLFGDALVRLKQYNKPIYILSTATAEGEQKADWIYDFGQKLVLHPEVVGWVWFNIYKERDWRVNSDPASLEAFKEIVP